MDSTFTLCSPTLKRTQVVADFALLPGGLAVEVEVEVLQVQLVNLLAGQALEMSRRPGS